MESPVVIACRPGSERDLIRLHVEYYAAHWNFDERFEAQVSRELAEFSAGFDPARDGFWRAEADGRVIGCVAVDGSRSGPGQARLRWFIVDQAFRGRGVGSALIGRAMDFCRERGFREVHLWTFAGLDAARSLYERCGFVLAEEAVDSGWGPEITEQKFILEPADPRG